MPEFKVKYEIDITASTPQEAAIEVEKILNRGYYRPHLTITDESGVIHNIDLEEMRV